MGFIVTTFVIIFALFVGFFIIKWSVQSEKSRAVCEERLVYYYAWLKSDEGLEFCKKNNVTYEYMYTQLRLLEISYRMAAR